ncbi:MAG: tRNA pseudouridine(55) synthase TruB [Gammaproteobacteria bacterium]|nr:tRNA pseudouridine(55) synthase TruB [Gammaproteobacteria bacterium]MDH5304416.1 tRNA pseudouridine(55) synthase TruB [Gammaproteobacteria bacterium]MDH5322059.1 tRNA pseudouridine(55) synthase TruB [Gammaproteobacteria bacterium]
MGSTRSRRDAVDGLLLLNKPAGLSSNQALQRVKRLLNAKKAGHTGSLDPAATGMLPLCFGEATKVCQFLLDADKTYRVTAKLGTATDTGDADGREIERREVPTLSAAAWDELLQGFVGETLQIPPMYSALKKDGKRLYEFARKGITVDRQARRIRIEAIELLETAAGRLVFRTRCSKGTYIRALVEDIARAAGTVAHTASLHREEVGDFQAADMLDLGTLELAAERGGGLQQHLIAPDRALARLPSVTLDDGDAARFCSGMASAGIGSGGPGLVRAYRVDARFLGVGEVSEDGSLTPRRVFHLGEKNP